MTYRDMSEMTRFKVATSEIVLPPPVYQAASQIFAAYIGKDMVTEENMAQMLEKSVQIAIELAIQTDKVIKAGEAAHKTPF